jgi:hypothetical protein
LSSKKATERDARFSRLGPPVVVFSSDEGVLTTRCTGCETRKGPFASGQKHSDSESSSSGIGADSSDEENIEGRKRRRKNTLPAAQEKEEDILEA